VTRTRQKNLFLSQRKKPHKDQRKGRKKHTKEKNLFESTIKTSRRIFSCYVKEKLQIRTKEQGRRNTPK
jgi:hypothetical protein